MGGSSEGERMRVWVGVVRVRGEGVGGSSEGERMRVWVGVVRRVCVNKTTKNQLPEG